MPRLPTSRPLAVITDKQMLVVFLSQYNVKCFILLCNSCSLFVCCSDINNCYVKSDVNFKDPDGSGSDALECILLGSIHLLQPAGCCFTRICRLSAGESCHRH